MASVLPHPSSKQTVRLRGRCGGSHPEQAAGGPGGAQSQVLQGFLSLLCVPVISVSVCPLAKGLMDVCGSLRVGQALLVPGEKAKPFGRGKETDGSECLPSPAPPAGFLQPWDTQEQAPEGADPFPVGDAVSRILESTGASGCHGSQNLSTHTE